MATHEEQVDELKKKFKSLSKYMQFCSYASGLSTSAGLTLGTIAQAYPDLITEQETELLNKAGESLASLAESLAKRAGFREEEVDEEEAENEAGDPVKTSANEIDTLLKEVDKLVK
jgi:hypothetical protein